ncbi:MAG: carboxypeptidase-like regulatory domain-containing protein, partial [Gemmatimonadaceae bacterium]
ALEYMIGERRLFRADLLVSTEMVRAKTDTTSITSWRGSSTLTGVLRDEKGRAISGATIAVLGNDSLARSDENGAFTVANVPAGTQLVQIRQIGFSPVSSLVDMRPGANTAAQFNLNRTVELKPVNVRADRTRPIDRIGYEERKRAGGGFYLENKDFKNAFHVGAIVQGLPNVIVDKSNRGTTVLMKKRGTELCVPRVYIDGYPMSIDDATVRSVDAYRAVEVYNRAINAPPQYASGECGVILFWTWHARW